VPQLPLAQLTAGLCVGAATAPSSNFIPILFAKVSSNPRGDISNAPFGNEKKLRIGWASAKPVAVEGPGSDALKEERLRSLKQARSRTSKTPALIDYARGASPSMRERRINRSHDA
jgi:hypothetical protein